MQLKKFVLHWVSYHINYMFKKNTKIKSIMLHITIILIKICNYLDYAINENYDLMYYKYSNYTNNFKMWKLKKIFKKIGRYKFWNFIYKIQNMQKRKII